MSHYLVTGAAGFIGAKVASLLLDDGHTVVGVDNMNHAYDVRLKEWRLAQLKQHPGFSFQQVDISDRQALVTALEGQKADGAINLAARAGVRPSVRDPRPYVQTNVLGGLNVLEWCREQGVPKLVQASTSSLYGLGNPTPFQETADITRPLSPYAATKGASELLCHTYHHLHGLDVTVVRYFTVYGPAGRPDMSIFRFIQWIAEGRKLRLYGDGTQKRDFTFVDDIARGTVMALAPLGYEIINLGGDRPASMNDVIGKIEALLGKTADVERLAPAPGDMPATWAKIDKAGRLLGWEPGTALDEGLEACVAWYLQERSWARQVETDD
jgi:nucleoside-diphosphate-sugar epimerase